MPITPTHTGIENKKLLLTFYGIPVLFVLYVIWNFHYISNDGVQYIDLGHRLFHSGIYDSAYGVVPGWMQSPGFPLVLGALSIIAPLHYVGYIAGIIFSMAILLFVAKFSRDQFGNIAGVITAVLLFTNPLYIKAAVITSSEPMYALVHFTIFLIIWLAVAQNRILSYPLILLLAVLSFMLFQIRTEGILYVGSLFAILIWKFRWKKSLLYLFTVAILCLPYANWIKSHSGSYNFLPKLMFNSRAGKLAQKTLLTGENRYLNSKESGDYVWYGLDEEKNELYAVNLLDNQYFKKLISDRSRTVTSDYNPEARFIINNKEVLRTLIGSIAFPFVFLLFILSGWFLLIRQNVKIALYIAVWIVPAFYFLISHVEERFFYIMLPYLCIGAGAGAAGLIKRRPQSPALISLLFIALLLNSAYYAYLFDSELKVKETEYRLGKELRQEISGNEIVCARNYQATFFGGFRFIKMPVCTKCQLHSYLAGHNAGYVLLAEDDLVYRSGFSPIYNEEASSFFKLQKTYRFGNRNVKLFKVL